VAFRVVTRPQRRAQRRRRTILSAWVTAFALLTVAAFHVVLAQSQITLDRMEQRTKAAEARYEEARLAYAEGSSPARILTRAAQLGLVSPDRPATAVPVRGDVPAPPDAPTTTMHGWTAVKPTLNGNP
jgi:Tfp pilus assembly protein PilX